MNALILVDIQNDFLPGGALAVRNGEQILPVVNGLQKLFSLIVATQDWHPPQHLSFAAQHPGKRPGDVVDLEGLPQTLWPVHCVQNTFGAEFSRALDMTRVRQVFQKGTEGTIDSYSGFFDNGHRRATGLGEYLKAAGVRQVTVVGLATDYCVKFTALDGVKLGFRTTVIADACRGVELQPGDSEKALEEMMHAGVEIQTSSTLTDKTS